MNTSIPHYIHVRPYTYMCIHHVILNVFLLFRCGHNISDYFSECFLFTACFPCSSFHCCHSKSFCCVLSHCTDSSPWDFFLPTLPSKIILFIHSHLKSRLCLKVQRFTEKSFPLQPMRFKNSLPIVKLKMSTHS